MRHFIFTIIFLLIAVSSFAGNLSKVPTDVSDKIAAAGSATVTWWDSTTTDGAFHSIALPSGVEAKAVLIQVVSTSITDYTNEIGFHYSSTGTSAADFGKHVGGVVISLGIKSGSIGYVRAAAGYKVAITVLY